MENQETLADLCEELRSGEYAPLADRIEAARRRECKNLDALERACEEVLDAETLKKVVAAKLRFQGEPENGEVRK